MEWKIGEIKQINGEWYQCVEGRCRDCYFSEKRYLCKQFITKNFCTSGIIFKKLEKVGEPYVADSKCCQQYQCYTTPLHNRDIIYTFSDNRVVLEIKNKEDMKEKNLKPFDLEAAKAGKPVCTRDGRKARIICFDKKEGAPIVALVEVEKNGRVFEGITLYLINGHIIREDIESKHDLMMLPEKKEGWVNLIGSNHNPHILDVVWDTKEEALDFRRKAPINAEIIATAKIEWEV